MAAWDGEEVTEVGCFGDRGTDVKCFISVWDAADGGAIIQVLGEHSFIHRRKLTSIGAESMTGAGNVEEDGKDIGERRCG